MNNKIKKLFLLSGDIFILYASLYLTLFLRYRENFSAEIWQNHYPPFSFIFISWIFIFYFSSLYNLYFTQNNKIFYRSIIKSIGIAGILAALFFYLNPSIGIAPKINLLLYILVFSLVFSLWRLFYNSILFSYLPKKILAFIGVNNQISEIINFLKENPNAGYKPLLIIDTKGDLSDNYQGLKVIKDSSNLKDDLRKNHINTIVLSTNPNNSNTLRQQLFSSLSLKLDFINSINFYELIVGKVPIDAINQMWFLENLNEGGKLLFDRAKGVFDFLFAFSILILTLPFWIIVIIIIKIESTGPVFFKQIRISKNGKEFSIIKFRTMKTEDNNFSPTTKNDPRITSFGLFLRKSRIDEIPQVLNILKGEMSFVGPRPERPEIIKELEKVVPFYRERMLVKPGLTGWDQVSGEYHSPSVDDTLKKLQFDLYYVKNRSLYLDASILLKTVSVVINRAGM